MQAVAERLSVFARRVRVRVDPRRAGALRARLFAAGAVREETVGADGTLELIAEIPEAQQAELARMPGVEVIELQAAAQTCVSADGYLQSPDDLRAP
jgi:ribosome maturation protein Sdo1